VTRPDRGPALTAPPRAPEPENKPGPTRSKRLWGALILILLFVAVIAIDRMAESEPTEAAGATAADRRDRAGDPSVAYAAQIAPLAEVPEPIAAELTLVAVEDGRPDPRELAYAAAIGEAMHALEAGALAESRAALADAERIFPGRTAGKDLALRLDMRQKLGDIEALLAEATRQEEGGQWRAAETTYATVLESDPLIARARTGRLRAREIADLIEALRFHADNPGRLTTPAVREEAETAIDRAARFDQSPTLTELAGRVEAAIRLWNTPISLVIRSDEKTVVTLGGVGRLGSFDQQALELPPGSYTLLGSRQGYRDVRIPLELEPGASPAPIRVVCEERL